ncbi:MAG: Asp-tRNA(Asn)/Glu-tRNA(Gln) amidotransferase subunit GatB [Eubacteriales bacterium]
MKYEIVIGLEVHAELSTRTKIFCSCKNEFGSDQNTNVCPVCLSMPGTLPVLNHKVVRYGVAAGMALNCEIPNFSKMDRKNYTYPDLSKSYQISQFEYPLCKRGDVVIAVDGQERTIGITRIHIEEDAGKLVHQSGYSQVDYNRGGVPLIEIVTEPDLRSADEVKVFLETVKANLEFLGVSDCKMQEGSLRCDVNVSVRPFGQKEYGTRTEMKNMNSFSAIYRAIDYETKRQIDLIEEGGTVIQETMRWDDAIGKTFSMRDKEEAHDYRYFPDPDLVPIFLTNEEIDVIRKSLPEFPGAKKARFMADYSLSDYDASILTSSKHTASFFEDCIAMGGNPKALCNYIMGDILRLLNEANMDTCDIPVSPAYLCDLLKMVEQGAINSSVGKQVFEEMFKTGKKPADIVKEKGLAQIDDADAIQKLVEQFVRENPKPAEDYKSGNKKAMTFFVGQVMKATGGKANPKTVNELVQKELEK